MTAALDDVARDATRRPVLVALDFDGTLAPLGRRPGGFERAPGRGRRGAARARRGRRTCRLALVSGRSRGDLSRRASPPVGTVLIGSHGGEIGGLAAEGERRSTTAIAAHRPSRTPCASGSGPGSSASARGPRRRLGAAQAGRGRPAHAARRAGRRRGGHAIDAVAVAGAADLGGHAMQRQGRRRGAGAATRRRATRCADLRRRCPRRRRHASSTPATTSRTSAPSATSGRPTSRSRWRARASTAGGAMSRVPDPERRWRSVLAAVARSPSPAETGVTPCDPVTYVGRCVCGRMTVGSRDTARDRPHSLGLCQRRHSDTSHYGSSGTYLPVRGMYQSWLRSLSTTQRRLYPGTERPAVDALNLHVEDGEFLVLVGPSGCGKSTSLRMLAGLEDVNGGRILIGDRDVTRRPAEGPRHRDGLPELRAVPAHDGRRQHGLRPEDRRHAEGGDPPRASRRPPRSST